MSSSQLGYAGQQQPFQGSGDYKAFTFLFKVLMSNISTVTLVQVVAVYGGGVAPVGYVDVQPLVNQLDGARNAVPHGVLHNIPYLRIQGGSSAFILDPKVGDIGMAGFCDRDITAVKSSKAQSNPGSLRSFDMADGLYIGGFLNGMPTQYVQLSDSGIKLHSPNAIILEASDIQMTAPTVEIVASTSTTVTTPIFRVNGLTQLNGNTQFGGTQGQLPGFTGDTTSTLNGPLNVTQGITSQGKNVGGTHTHPVTTAPGTTGAPT